MRFMMLVIPKAYENVKADFVPPVDLVAKMTKYNESLRKAGVLLSLDGLTPPAKAARVLFSGGKPRVFSRASSTLRHTWSSDVCPSFFADFRANKRGARLSILWLACLRPGPPLPRSILCSPASA